MMYNTASHCGIQYLSLCFSFSSSPLRTQTVLLIKITVINRSDIGSGKCAVPWKTTILTCVMGRFTYVILIKKNEYIQLFSNSQKAGGEMHQLSRLLSTRSSREYAISEALTVLKDFTVVKNSIFALENILTPISLFHCKRKIMLL